MSTVLYKTFSYAVSQEIKFTIHAEYNGKQYKSLMTAMLSQHDRLNLSTAWEWEPCDYRISICNQCSFAALHHKANPPSQTTLII